MNERVSIIGDGAMGTVLGMLLAERGCAVGIWGAFPDNIEAMRRARENQRQRFANTSPRCNADMGPTEVRQVCVLDDAGRALVRAAMQQLQMSARAFHRILKLARTIADLAGSERIETAHLAEAIQYRPRRAV